MSTYINYWKSSDKGLLDALVELYPDGTLGPAHGINAASSRLDSEGNKINGAPGIGDSSYWYLMVRSESELSVPDGVESSADIYTFTTLLGIFS